MNNDPFGKACVTACLSFQCNLCREFTAVCSAPILRSDRRRQVYREHLCNASCYVTRQATAFCTHIVTSISSNIQSPVSKIRPFDMLLQSNIGQSVVYLFIGLTSDSWQLGVLNVCCLEYLLPTYIYLHCM